MPLVLAQTAHTAMNSRSLQASQPTAAQALAAGARARQQQPWLDARKGTCRSFEHNSGVWGLVLGGTLDASRGLASRCGSSEER